MGLLDRLLGNRDNISDREFSEEDLKKMSIEELEKLKAELEVKVEELERKSSELGAAPKTAAAEPAPDKPIADKPKAEEKKSFFDQSDAEALKAVRDADREARDAKKRKAEEEDRIIREAETFAMNCLVDALKELPQLAAASGQEYVKLYTGACRPETEIIEEEYRSGRFKTETKRTENHYTAYFYADTEGKVEKHCGLDLRRAANDVREGSFEDIRSTFRSRIDKTRFNAIEYSSKGGVLDRLVFEGSWHYCDGDICYDFKDIHKLNCMRSRDEIVKTVKEMIFWCLKQKKNVSDWPPGY